MLSWRNQLTEDLGCSNNRWGRIDTLDLLQVLLDHNTYNSLSFCSLSISSTHWLSFYSQLSISLDSGLEQKVERQRGLLTTRILKKKPFQSNAHWILLVSLAGVLKERSASFLQWEWIGWETGSVWKRKYTRNQGVKPYSFSSYSHNWRLLSVFQGLDAWNS